MKRTIWIALVLLLMCVFVLSACDSGDTPPSNGVTDQTGSNNDGGNNEVDSPPTTCQHVASNWIIDKATTCKEAGSKHKECTKCEEVLETASIDKLTTHTPVIDSRVEPTFTSTGLTEGSHCGVCGVVIVAQDVIPMIPSKTTLTTTTLALDGRNISGSFSYATEIFNFANDIIVTNNSPWVVSTDSYGMQTAATKIVPLNEGNNIFYIHVTNPDQTVSTYTVNIYRNHLYTVSFNTNGGTGVSTQHVEEGYLAQQPTTTRAGYTFSSWDYDFSSPIRSNITINANWNANGNTPYKVEYYRQNLDRNGYELIVSETEVLAGKTDTTAYAEQKIFEHFTLNKNMSALSGNIDGDGSRILKLYYTRDTYTISLTKNNTKAGTITSGGTYAYDKSITITATTNAGYTFLGWYKGETKISDNLSYTFNVDHSATITAKWEARTDTPYRVEYYLENVDKNGYDILDSETENLIGTTDTIATAEQKYFEHFAFDEAKSVVTGNINGDEILVLTIYYTRNVYILSNSNTSYGSITNAGSYVYGSGESFKTVATVPKLGYEFLGWYSGEELLSTEYEYTFNIDRNVIAKFDIAEGMKNFKFTSTATTCSITGIKNKAVIEIIVPDYVTSISSSAFSGCFSLQSITLPFIGGSTYSSYPLGYIFGSTSYTGGVATRQKYLYSATSITSNIYYIPSKLQSVTITGSNIPFGAFSNCTNITSVTIGNNVTSIASSAFEGCTGLTSVNISDIVAWCNISFGDANANPFYYADDLYINGELVTQIVIPDSITSISPYAFSYCTSLTSITVSENVTNIGDYAFSNCTGLDNITIPQNVTNIGASVFHNCKNLKSIEVANDNDVYKSIDGNLYTYDGRILIQYAIGKTATEFAVSNSVTSIEAYAFAYCSSLVEIMVPDSVDSIGACAFFECSSLETITLPFVGANKDASYNKVQGRFTYIFGFENHGRATECDCRDHDAHIDANYYIQKIPSSLKNVIITGGTVKTYAFEGCKMIENVTIGGSVDIVKCYAFQNCTSLKCITIGASVNEIQRNAFDGCKALEYAVFEVTTGWCYYEWYEYYDISSSSLADKTTARYYFNYGDKLIRR